MARFPSLLCLLHQLLTPPPDLMQAAVHDRRLEELVALCIIPPDQEEYLRNCPASVPEDDLINPFEFPVDSTRIVTTSLPENCSQEQQSSPLAASDGFGEVNKAAETDDETHGGWFDYTPIAEAIAECVDLKDD